jgi:hypothetical protein
VVSPAPASETDDHLAADPPHKLPDPLRALAMSLQAGGEKGEQEGYL